MRVVFVVHRAYVIEPLEILGDRLTPAQPADVRAAAARRRLGAVVGRLAYVIRMGAGGNDLDAVAVAGILDQFTKDPLGHRRATDIAEANEQYAHHRLTCPPWRSVGNLDKPQPAHPCADVRRRECTLSAFATAPPHPRPSASGR